MILLKRTTVIPSPKRSSCSSACAFWRPYSVCGLVLSVAFGNAVCPSKTVLLERNTTKIPASTNRLANAIVLSTFMRRVAAGSRRQRSIEVAPAQRVPPNRERSRDHRAGFAFAYLPTRIYRRVPIPSPGGVQAFHPPRQQVLNDPRPGWGPGP